MLQAFFAGISCTVDATGTRREQFLELHQQNLCLSTIRVCCASELCFYTFTSMKLLQKSMGDAKIFTSETPRPVWMPFQIYHCTTLLWCNLFNFLSISVSIQLFMIKSIFDRFCFYLISWAPWLSALTMSYHGCHCVNWIIITRYVCQGPVNFMADC